MKTVKDPQEAEKLQDQILGLLPNPEMREVEKELIHLLNFEGFDLINILVKNRYEIFFCLRLSRAKTEDQIEAIKNEMRGDEKGSEILARLDLRKTKSNLDEAKDEVKQA